MSTAVSIGGDAIIGSSYAELMPLFEADADTQAIVIYTEPGGRMEAELARWVTENNSRLPIVAFMAGRFMDEMPGMSFGHAGTIVEGKEDTATEKIARLAAAGITVAERIEDIPGLVKEKLGGGLMAGTFIDVEVDATVAADPELAAQAGRGLPGRHLQGRRRRRRARRGQPRRVRALRALHPRRAGRAGPVLKLYSGESLPAWLATQRSAAEPLGRDPARVRPPGSQSAAVAGRGQRP